MATLRIENYRHGAWTLRGEGPIPATTTLDQIKADTDRAALNGPARALLDGAQVYETKKLTARRAKAAFGV
jgi:hypothetical protein